MEYVKSKVLNRQISKIGLGTWAIGGMMWGGTNEKESIDTILSAIDRGINLIDTAPAYGFGKSENIIGKALKESGKRDEIILATKVALEWDKDENIFRNSSSERIFREIDDSLNRLQTDYIDIYQVHWPDPLVSIEETAVAMQKLLDDGIIRAIGVSNYSPEQMDRFRSVSPLHFCQPPYNLFERKMEKEILPYCKENGIHLLTYGALCRGLLTGKMNSDTEFKGDDLRKNDPKFRKPLYNEYLNAVSKLQEFVNRRFRKEILHLAVRWIFDKGVETALWGARYPHQLDAINEIWDWKLNNSDLIEIEEIITNTISKEVGPEFMAPYKRTQTN